MGASACRCLTLAALLVILSASATQAQRPVCPAVAPGERVVAVCRSLSLYPAVRFLADFTVDQLFKPAPPPFSRSLLEAAQIFAGREIVTHEHLKKHLAGLAPVHFAQLDRTTGSVLAEWKESPRETTTVLEEIDGKPSLTVRTPEVLQGGYWRGPDVLQIAFWEGKRIGVEVVNGQARVGGDVECLSLSPDALLLRFASAAAPPLLIQLRECIP